MDTNIFGWLNSEQTVEKDTKTQGCHWGLSWLNHLNIKNSRKLPGTTSRWILQMSCFVRPPIQKPKIISFQWYVTKASNHLTWGAFFLLEKGCFPANQMTSEQNHQAWVWCRIQRSNTWSKGWVTSVFCTASRTGKKKWVYIHVNLHILVPQQDLSCDGHSRRKKIF